MLKEEIKEETSSSGASSEVENRKAPQGEKKDQTKGDPVVVRKQISTGETKSLDRLVET
jgi:hypothetical protein